MHDEKKIEEILQKWKVPEGVVVNEMFFEYGEHMVQQERDRLVNIISDLVPQSAEGLKELKELGFTRMFVVLINLINKDYE